MSFLSSGRALYRILKIFILLKVCNFLNIAFSQFWAFLKANILSKSIVLYNKVETFRKVKLSGSKYTALKATTNWFIKSVNFFLNNKLDLILFSNSSDIALYFWIYIFFKKAWFKSIIIWLLVNIIIWALLNPDWPACLILGAD